MKTLKLLFLFLCINLAASAQIKISELPLISGNDIDSLVIPANQMNATKKVYGYQVVNHIKKLLQDSIRLDGKHVQARKNGEWLTQFDLPRMADSIRIYEGFMQLRVDGEWITQISYAAADSFRVHEGKYQLRIFEQWYDMGDVETTVIGDGLHMNDDTLNLGGSYAENILIHSLDGKEFRVRSGKSNDTNAVINVTNGTAVLWSETFISGDKYLSLISVSESGVQLYTDNTTIGGGVYEFNFNLNDGVTISNNDGTYGLAHPVADIENKIMVGNSSNRLEFQPISSFLTPNFPTVNDTITSTKELYTGSAGILIKSASNSLKLNNDGMEYITFFVKNTITDFEQTYRTGSDIENGELFIGNSYAKLSARNAAGKTGSFTAFRNYAQIAAADSLKITGLQEKAIDTLDYQLVIDANNRVHKVKRQVLIADSTVTVTDSTITVNRSAVLGYREIEGIIKSDGSFILLRSDLGGDWEVKGEYDSGIGDFFGIYAKDSVEVTDTYLDFDPEKTTVYVSNNITHDGSNFYSYVSKVSSAIVPSVTAGYVQVFYYKDFDASTVQPFAANAQADINVLIRIYE